MADTEISTDEIIKTERNMNEKILFDFLVNLNIQNTSMVKSMRQQDVTFQHLCGNGGEEMTFFFYGETSKHKT